MSRSIPAAKNRCASSWPIPQSSPKPKQNLPTAHSACGTSRSTSDGALIYQTSFGSVAELCLVDSSNGLTSVFTGERSSLWAKKRERRIWLAGSKAPLEEDMQRSDFLKSATGAVAASSVFPQFAIGKAGMSANSKLNVAFVGSGGWIAQQPYKQGSSEENLVAPRTQRIAGWRVGWWVAKAC